MVLVDLLSVILCVSLSIYERSYDRIAIPSQRTQFWLAHYAFVYADACVCVNDLSHGHFFWLPSHQALAQCSFVFFIYSLSRRHSTRTHNPNTHFGQIVVRDWAALEPIRTHTHTQFGVDSAAQTTKREPMNTATAAFKTFARRIGRDECERDAMCKNAENCQRLWKCYGYCSFHMRSSRTMCDTHNTISHRMISVAFGLGIWVNRASYTHSTEANSRE